MMRNPEYARCAENSIPTDAAGEARAERADLRSADELISLAEWEFRSDPFRLGLVREIYNRCCFDLMLALGAARQ
jgi:hypothetical protein